MKLPINWKIAGIALASLALVQCGGAEEATQDLGNRTAPHAGAASGNGSGGLTRPDPAERDQICRAAIAAVNGIDIGSIAILDSSEDMTRLGFAVASDRAQRKNDCRIQAGRIIWRTVDAFGTNSGLGRWRAGPADEVIRYETDANGITITTTTADGTERSEHYPVSAL